MMNILRGIRFTKFLKFRKPIRANFSELSTYWNNEHHVRETLKVSLTFEPILTVFR